MASDLPETFRSSNAMAKALSSYIECPYRVRAIVLENFKSAPHTDAIREMRRKHLTPSVLEQPFKIHEGYYPADASERARLANEAFLLRLAAERRRSLGLRSAA